MLIIIMVQQRFIITRLIVKQTPIYRTVTVKSPLSARPADRGDFVSETQKGDGGRPYLRVGG